METNLIDSLNAVSVLYFISTDLVLYFSIDIVLTFSFECVWYSIGCIWDLRHSFRIIEQSSRICSIHIALVRVEIRFLLRDTGEIQSIVHHSFQFTGSQCRESNSNPHWNSILHDPEVRMACLEVV